ncbi:MAG: hypothetical protein Q8P67_19900, partial [archaeon]|nr:hypothetical protein [archaeon]
LARQLVVSYLQNQRTKRARDLLLLLSRILSFSEEDKAALGLTPASLQTRWLSSWFSSSSSSVADVSAPSLSQASRGVPKSSSSISVNADASLTDLWLQFLLKEAQDDQSST